MFTMDILPLKTNLDPKLCSVRLDESYLSPQKLFSKILLAHLPPFCHLHSTLFVGHSCT